MGLALRRRYIVPTVHVEGASWQAAARRRRRVFVLRRVMPAETTCHALRGHYGCGVDHAEDAVAGEMRKTRRQGYRQGYVLVLER